MENVLVVNSEPYDKLLNKHGLIPDASEVILTHIKKDYFFMSRDIAEYCSEVRQIIPYVLIRRNDSVFAYRRLSAQSEKRLHNKLSVGIGGHINNCDIDNHDIIMSGLKRELSEEVSISGDYSLQYVGVINNLSTEVSKYHIGLLYLLDTNCLVEVVEKDKLLGEWIKFSELKNFYESMEDWSQIALECVLNNY